MISLLVAGYCLAAAIQTPPAQATAAKPAAPQDSTVYIGATRQKELNDDIELGKKYEAEVDKTLKLSTNKEYIDRVNRIGSELAAIANAHQVQVSWGDPRPSVFPYKFKVVEDKDVNAFSLPGGIIYVNEGILKFAETDDEIAGVLGHEISHAAFRHIATLQSKASKFSAIEIPLILAAILTGGAAVGIIPAVNMTGTAITNGWSEQAESAADFGGLQFLTYSRYNPTGILTFMERLGRKDRAIESMDWGIYRTHPPSAERAHDLIQHMQELGIPIRRSAVSISMRAVAKPGVAGGTVDVWFGDRKVVTFGGADALKRADDASDHLNSFFDSFPEVFDVNSRPSGDITGKGQLLFTIMPADAAISKQSQDAYQATTVKSIKACLMSIGFRTNIG